MKKKSVKVLSALALSAVMMTVTVGTAMAAIQPRYDACTHGREKTYRTTEYAEANSQYHWAQDYIVTECFYCNEEIDKYAVGAERYESHNLTGISNGGYRCVDCDYEEAGGTK